MNLKKKYIYILMGILVLSIVGCRSQNIKGSSKGSSGKSDKITVAVSIVPQETFVKAIAGELVNVITMIPPGNSPANYQPTPREMTSLSESEIYFSIGVATEKSNIIGNIKEFNKDIKVVDLADKVSGVYPEHSYGEDRDPHIWLSPKRVKVMIEAIKDELIGIDLANREIYEKNAKSYITKLDEIDMELKEKFRTVDQRSFIMYHPAFGYFADDYDLNMVAIEEDGKDTTVQNLQKVIELAKREKIKYVFYQAEFDDRQAEIVAKEIDGKAIKVAPLSPDYIESLKGIADKF